MRKKGILNYLLIAVFALSAAFTSCDKNNDDNNNGNGNGNGNEPEKEWVEIGGAKWATRNVDKPGTFAAKPEDAGMFYQWNRKIGWSSTDPMTNSNGGTTWDSSRPTGDSWAKSNDPCPSGWRVPTKEEFESLLSSGSTWDELNGVNGRFFGSDTEKIFLPAAGRRSNLSGTLDYVGSQGVYWNSTVISSEGAHGLNFRSENASMYAYDFRNGILVRCVKE